VFILGDLRQAVRSIVRMPALSSVIVLSLAVGIGVNTVVFSWIQARVLRPIPGARDSAAVQLVEPNPVGGHYPGASWLEYQDLRDNLQSFESLFAARTVPLYVGDTGAVERLFGLLISQNYFSALGVEPALGRFFTADEMRSAGAPSAIVISHRLWQTRFAGSADVVARTIRVNGRELNVIGVVPDAFQGSTPGLQFDGYLPATLAPAVVSGSRELTDRGVRGYGVMGRLRPGVSRRQAQAEFDASMRRLERDYPSSNIGMRGEVLPFYMSPRGPQRMLNAALAILQAVMLLVLLAVCGNIANLTLARGSARQKEVGIRLSLGARRRRIASLLLTESVLLASAGALLGAAAAVWGTHALIVLPITGMPLRFQTSIDALGLSFAILLGIASGVIFGLAPALQLARVDPHAVLRNALASGGRSRLRRVLMGAQVALAILVLLVAGMFFRSFLETRDTDPGFRRAGVLLAAYDRSDQDDRAAPSCSGCEPSTINRVLATRLLEAVRVVPGVEAVTVATSVPLDIHGLPSRAFTVEGYARTDGGADSALTNTVTPGYFAVMKIPIVAGSDFAPLIDAAAPRQVIVNQAFVRRFVPGGQPLGRQLRARGGVYVITGVAANSLYNAFGEPPTPAIYFSYRDLPQPRGEIHVRASNGDASGVGAAILQAARAVDPELPVFNLRTLDEHVDTNLVLRKVPAAMFSVLGPLLLALAAIGIYAVVNYAVSLRTREIGLRIALGATRRRVVAAFVREHLRVALYGAVTGWLVAFMLAIHLAPGRRVDAAVFAGVPAILLMVATVACWIPARRGARVDPAVALRND
jgi:predicted permease